LNREISLVNERGWKLGRVRTTLFAVVAIAIILFVMVQVQSGGAPWVFTAFEILMIVMIVISVIRAWLRL
jgi:hypothetical protein